MLHSLRHTETIIDLKMLKECLCILIVYIFWPKAEKSCYFLSFFFLTKYPKNKKMHKKHKNSDLKKKTVNSDLFPLYRKRCSMTTVYSAVMKLTNDREVVH